MMRRIAFGLVACLALESLSETLPATPEELLEKGFTIRLQVDTTDVRADEPLYEMGPVSLGLRMAGRDAKMAKFDNAQGNYLSFPLADGSCPVLEALICEKGGRIGIPLGVLERTGGVHAVELRYAPPHWQIGVDGRMDEEMPVKAYPVRWKGASESRVLSPRVRSAVMSPGARLPVKPDARPITRPIQYWTPDDHNAWVGDVTVGIWRNRFHVFYLFDRRHHWTGAGVGRHYFAHLSSGDLKNWVEHPDAVPVEEWYDSFGTGTPFVWGDKYCISYGYHSGRIAKNGEDVPRGGSYSWSTDGIHFTKSRIVFCKDENPSVYNRTDGRLGMVSREPGAFYVSSDGTPNAWQRIGSSSPTGGDCPCVFTWNGWEYLFHGFGWMAARPATGDDTPWEDWTLSGDNIYDGVCVPMVAPRKGDRRIYVGWKWSMDGWAGWLVFRELIQYPDGKLGIRWLDEAPPPVRPHVWHVDKLDEPFVRRFDSLEGGDSLEFRIDPKRGRAQFAVVKKDAKAEWAKTLSDCSRQKFPEDLKKDQHGPNGYMFVTCGSNYAIDHIRGLDRPFDVRFVQYYDPKARQTVFDAEIAAQRTMMFNRRGKFAVSGE